MEKYYIFYGIAGTKGNKGIIMSNGLASIAIIMSAVLILDKGFRHQYINPQKHQQRNFATGSLSKTHTNSYKWQLIG